MWKVRAHPAHGEAELIQTRGPNSWFLDKRLLTFDTYRAFPEKPNRGIGMTLALGTTDAASAWQIVSIERIFTGEDLLTLRARSTLGILPELDPIKVPPRALPRLHAALSAVADAAFREGATSIIDRCRDTAQIALWESIAHVDGQDPHVNKEIGALCEHLERNRSNPPRMLLSCARLIAQLHARGKPTEQLKHGKDEPVEGDAATAIGALGMLVRELGWTLD